MLNACFVLISSFFLIGIMWFAIAIIATATASLDNNVTKQQYAWHLPEKATMKIGEKIEKLKFI